LLGLPQKNFQNETSDFQITSPVLVSPHFKTLETTMAVLKKFIIGSAIVVLAACSKLPEQPSPGDLPADPVFIVAAQSAVRNCACTVGSGTADNQDGAFVNLSPSVGGFMWRVEILPSTAGRNGLALDWMLYTNSRAYSPGGWFGKTPATLACFERVRIESGKYIYQEREVRKFVFDRVPGPGIPAGGDPGNPRGAAARARYEVMKDNGNDIQIRRPDGTRLTFFHPLGEAPTAGALKSIANRFGDTITHEYDEQGQLKTVSDSYGRTWAFRYGKGRLVEIREDKTTLRGRTVRFSYDQENRLRRIDTTPVLSDGGIGNQFPDGKPYVLVYPAATGDPALDTNITAVIYPNQVLDGSMTPRIQNVYGADDRLLRQTWGGTNASGLAAGGELIYAYDDTAMRTTVTDRNDNTTTYTFNQLGLATKIEEFTNRRVRAKGDPESYKTLRTYNKDEEVTLLTRPLGNQVRTTFDVTNLDRYAHGNVLEVRQIADAIRGGDGAGATIADIVETYAYEPIFQLVRIETSARGNDPRFVPPIDDNEANVQNLDFNLDGDTNDPSDGETVRARRYSTLSIYDYQEGTAGEIAGLAAREGISLTTAQATALSVGADLNQDQLTDQRVGRPVEKRYPTVTLEDGTGQTIVYNYRWNDFALLKEEVDPEGYVTQYIYSPATTPNAGTGIGPQQGGYLYQVIADATAPRIRKPMAPPPDPSPVAAATTTVRDAVGNVIASIDPRGVRHLSVVNERNQIQVAIVAADTSALNPEEPRPLAALEYETRTYFDGNDNITGIATENVVDRGGGAHQRVSGNPWLETTHRYDLLDNVVETSQEVAAGETRTIRDYVLPVGAAEKVTTRFRYDRNQNPVLTLFPLAVARAAGQENNVSSQIYDERDLIWKSSRGGIDLQWRDIAAHQDILLSPGVRNTFRTSTTRALYDANRNVRLTIDAEDNGSRHDGTSGLPDTEDPTVAGVQRGDPIETRYDGFDRVLVRIDAMGYRTAMGCGCGGGEIAYDPDSNILTKASIGPADSNLRGGHVDDRLLDRSRSFHDELSRVYRSESDYFRLPQPLDAPVIESVYVSKTRFDRNSRIIRQTRPLGDFVEQVLDGLDRVVIRRSNPLTGPAGTLVPSEIRYRYDDAGNQIQSSEFERSVKSGREEIFWSDTFFDAANRPELSISNHLPGTLEANATRTQYDSRDNTVATIDANATGLIPLKVDRNGPLTVQINTTGNATVFVHDGLGRIVRTLREFRLNHDGANGLDKTNSRNADGLITVLQDWDANSRLVGVTDDPDTSVAARTTNPGTTRYEYDELDRRTRQTNADGMTRQYIYDRDNNLAQFIDENGSVISRSFDDINRVVQLDITQAAGIEGTTRQIVEYDGLSRITRATDDNGSQVDSSVVRSYDSRSRIQEDNQQIGASIRLVSLEYDRNSNLIQLTYPAVILGGGNRRQVTYGYLDSQGRTLNRIELIEEGAGAGTGNNIVPTGAPGGKIADYDYIGPTRIELRQYGNGGDGNGVLAEYTYDPLRRLTGVSHRHTNLGGVFADFGYAFDRNDNRLNEIFRHDNVQNVYRYDSQNRLRREDQGAAVGGIKNNQAQNPGVISGRNRTWDGLDGANNWNQVNGTGGFDPLTIAANEMNEYIAVNAAVRRHDANGNLIEDSRYRYFYDGLNRLVRVEQKTGNQTIGRYAYDYFDRRIRREIRNTGFDGIARYLYTPRGDLIEEDDDQGKPARQYVWHPSGNLLQYVDGVTLFAFLPFNVHENGYGSIVFTTPLAAESIANRRAYDAYGNVTELKAEQATVLPYAFRSWRFDPETGLYLLGEGVYYEPGLGRTTSRAGKTLENAYAWGGNNLLILAQAGPGAGNICRQEGPGDGGVGGTRPRDPRLPPGRIPRGKSTGGVAPSGPCPTDPRTFNTTRPIANLTKCVSLPRICDPQLGKHEGSVLKAFCRVKMSLDCSNKKCDPESDTCTPAVGESKERQRRFLTPLGPIGFFNIPSYTIFVKEGTPSPIDHPRASGTTPSCPRSRPYMCIWQNVTLNKPVKCKCDCIK
jgi:YD repeat-containing protein